MTLDSPFPFGKYRGQPLAVVLADANYTKWMVEQVGIAEKFPNIINFIANGSAEEKNQTPAHNKMQVRFLDDKVRRAVAQAMLKPGLKVYEVGPATFEFHGWDVRFDFTYLGPGQKWDQSRCAYADVGEMEHSAILNIELKPTISEDYPAVLRQVKKRKEANKFVRTTETAGRSVVLADEFNSHSATFPQVSAMFSSSNITLLLWPEIGEALSRDDFEDISGP